MEAQRWLVLLEEGLPLLRERFGGIADQLPALAPQHIDCPHRHLRPHVEDPCLLLVGGHMDLVIPEVDRHVLVVVGEHEVSSGLYLSSWEGYL